MCCTDIKYTEMSEPAMSTSDEKLAKLKAQKSKHNRIYYMKHRDAIITKNRANRQLKTATLGDFTCEPCKAHFTVRKCYTTHFKSNAHKYNIEMLAKCSNPL